MICAEDNIGSDAVLRRIESRWNLKTQAAGVKFELRRVRTVAAVSKTSRRQSPPEELIVAAESTLAGRDPGLVLTVKSTKQEL